MKSIKQIKSNVPATHRSSFGRQFKTLVAEAYLSTPRASYESIGRLYSVSGTRVSYWTRQYTQGLLSESNAVAFSRRPELTSGKKEALVSQRQVNS